MLLTARQHSASFCQKYQGVTYLSKRGLEHCFAWLYLAAETVPVSCAKATLLLTQQKPAARPRLNRYHKLHRSSAQACGTTI